MLTQYLTQAHSLVSYCAKNKKSIFDLMKDELLFIHFHLFPLNTFSLYYIIYLMYLIYKQPNLFLFSFIPFQPISLLLHPLFVLVLYL